MYGRRKDDKTDRERIEELERKVAELEARPPIIVMPYVPPVPVYPRYPSYPSYPWTTITTSPNLSGWTIQGGNS